MIYTKKLTMIVNIFFIITMALVPANSNAFDVDAVSSGGASILRNVQWHGYYEFEYWGTQDKRDTFDAHKITLWMGVPINERVFIASEFEYEHFPRLEDAGEQRNGGSGELKLDSAQIRVDLLENFTAYAGVFYVPFGIEYLSYPGHKNKLITRPKVMKSGSIIPGTWSDVGVGSNYVLNGIGQFDIFYVNGDAKNGGISRDSKAGGNSDKSVGVRVMLDGLMEGLNLGGSYVIGAHDEDDSHDSSRIGAHFRLDTNVLTKIDAAPVLLAEYVTGEDEWASSVAGKDKEVYGYYVQLSSRLHPFVELTGRYGQYDNDEEKDDNRKTEASIGLALPLLDNFIIKGEYQWNKEQGINKKSNNAGIAQIVAHW